jgi:hypothetical protein
MSNNNTSQSLNSGTTSSPASKDDLIRGLNEDLARV